MWRVRNVDLVVNTLKAEQMRSVGSAALRVTRFIRDLGAQHPCDDQQDFVTRMLFTRGEDWFALHLPDHWYVPYHVLPSCKAKSGEVMFAKPRRVAKHPPGQ